MPDEVLLRTCRKLASDQPARALVLLWRYLRDHGNFEHGFSRDRCLREAERAQTDLEAGRPLPQAHPAALLRAVDGYLAQLDLGQEPRVRRIDVPGAPSRESYFVVSRPRGWRSRLALGQPGHLEYWMRRHQVVPTNHRGISIEIHRPSHDLLDLLAAPQMPFVTGGFRDGVLPDWNEQSPFRCQRLRDPDTRWQSVLNLLAEARGRGAALVVLPELTIDPQVRARLRDWLRAQPQGSG